jgi:DnaJ-related protein SCJ1
MSIKTKFSVLLLFVIIVNCGEDFYKLLEVSRDAKEQEIKKSFRNLSKRYHPDKNPGDRNAHDMFLKINKAYETLMDEEKRKQYDIYGEEGLEQNHQMSNQQRQKGPNAKVDLSVELDDLYNGAVKELAIQKNILCPKCRGTGGKLGNTKQCPICNGRGVTLQEIDTGMGFRFQTQNTCNRCKGKGIVFTETCPHCRGNRVVKEDKKLRIDIERGMRDGQHITFDRESEQHPDMVPGDLIVTLRQKQHKTFHSRQGDDLHSTLTLSLKEALLGYSKSIQHLDKRSFYIDSNKPTQPFQVRKIDGEGMPQHNFPSQKGDLYVKFNVRLPDKLNESEKEIVKQLFE